MADSKYVPTLAIRCVDTAENGTLQACCLIGHDLGSFSSLLHMPHSVRVLRRVDRSSGRRTSFVVLWITDNYEPPRQPQPHPQPRASPDFRIFPVPEFTQGQKWMCRRRTFISSRTASSTTSSIKIDLYSTTRNDIVMTACHDLDRFFNPILIDVDQGLYAHFYSGMHN